MKNIYADSDDEYQPRKCINGELEITNKRAFYPSIYCNTP